MELKELLQHLLENHYETASVIIFVVGLAGLLLNRNLFKKMVSMGFMDSAIFLFLTSTGYIEGRMAPIIADPSVPATMRVYSSPLPAGLVLTGIVVSVSFTAFGLALTMRLYKKYHSLDIDDIMMQILRSED